MLTIYLMWNLLQPVAGSRGEPASLAAGHGQGEPAAYLHCAGDSGQDRGRHRGGQAAPGTRLGTSLTWTFCVQAHQSLVDLENSRDDLLFELHRLGHNNSRDRDLLKEYFETVTDLSSKLEKQLGFILMRTFATVRKSPRELVSALRIVEREERADEDCVLRQRQTGFMPPGRPKR